MRLFLSLLFLITINSTAFAEEPRSFTEQDLKKYQPAQESICKGKTSTDYIMCIWEKIDEACGYLSSSKKTKNELLAAFKECDSLMYEIDAHKNIPHNTKIQMMNKITGSIKAFGNLIGR